jgi:hypothetical protein
MALPQLKSLWGFCERESDFKEAMLCFLKKMFRAFAIKISMKFEACFKRILGFKIIIKNKATLCY